MSKFTIANLKVKYAAISTGTWNSKQKLTTTKSGQQIRPPSPKEGSFTETERAILLRSVIDAVHSKGVPFKIWHKHGLSRIYFADNSWLSYSPQGVCIFGPNKSGTAYQIRSELGLKKPAIRSVIL